MSLFLGFVECKGTLLLMFESLKKRYVETTLWSRQKL